MKKWTLKLAFFEVMSKSVQEGWITAVDPSVNSIDGLVDTGGWVGVEVSENWRTFSRFELEVAVVELQQCVVGAEPQASRDGNR